MKDAPFAILFYVSNATASCDFYRRILDCEPIEASVNFAMFPLKGGGLLGLWAAADVAPAIAGRGTEGELAFKVDSPAEVDRFYERWSGEHLPIAQRPTDLDFGHTFTALDPDGHRLRVMALRPA